MDPDPAGDFLDSFSDEFTGPSALLRGIGEMLDDLAGSIPPVASALGLSVLAILIGILLVF